VLVPCYLSDPAHRRGIVAKAVEEFGRVDVLVSHAACQMSREAVEEMPDREWDDTIAVNLSAMFRLVKAGIANTTAAPAPLRAGRGIRA